MSPPPLPNAGKGGKEGGVKTNPPPPLSAFILFSPEKDKTPVGKKESLLLPLLPPPLKVITTVPFPFLLEGGGAEE